MLLRIIAVGSKMPAWITAGLQDYLKRFPPGWRFELCEIPAEKRFAHSDIAQIIEKESEKIMAALKSHHRVVALDVKGQSWHTEQLAKQLQLWSQSKQNIDFIIGGPDGLSAACLAKAEVRWSLSPLTLPHPLVRIILVEQLYRGLSILQNHPYHR